MAGNCREDGDRLLVQPARLKDRDLGDDEQLVQQLLHRAGIMHIAAVSLRMRSLVRPRGPRWARDNLPVTLLGTHRAFGELARALRAGDDTAAARLATESGLPAGLLTHRDLGPLGSVPEQAVADALAVVAALAAAGPGREQPPEAGTLARRHRLADPGVLDVVADEVEAAAVPGASVSHPWAAGLSAIDAAGSRDPGLRAAALLLHARAAEGAGRAGDARVLAGQSLAAAPGLLPAVRDVMEYELCAGNWARAWELADSIRTDRIAEPLLRCLGELRQPAAGPGQVSRNQPCPCGSGRKYKACCAAKDARSLPHPLSLRAEALYAMIASYAQRAPRREIRDRYIACVIGAPQAAMLALDLAVFDGGGAARFLADRGFLLRPDERELLSRWLTVPVDLYEVTRVWPGSQIRLRSLVGGPRSVDQRDRMLSLTAPAGPAGDQAAAGWHPAAGTRRDRRPPPRPPAPGLRAIPGRAGAAGPRW